jgi:hypothetical protein
VSCRGAPAPADAARPGSSGGAPASAPADGDGDELSGVGLGRRRQEARSSNDARRIHAKHFSYDWEEGLIGEENLSGVFSRIVKTWPHQGGINN